MIKYVMPVRYSGLKPPFYIYYVELHVRIGLAAFGCQCRCRADNLHLNTVLSNNRLTRKHCSLSLSLSLSSAAREKGVVTDEVVSLMEGDNVTLHANTEIQPDDKIEWRFGDELDLLARINRAANLLKIYDNIPDGRFRDRLQVNNQTGDLTITNITTQHSGLYQLDISSETETIKRFSVYVLVDKDKVNIVMVGDSVIQYNNITKKPGDEKIVWRIQHNNSLVAEIIRNGKETNDEVYNERFRDRLKVNDQTGDLNITNITPDDFGSYDVNITVGSHIYTIHRTFSVPVKDPRKGRLENNEDQDQSSGSRSLTPEEIFGVFLGVLVAVAAVGLIIYCKRSRTAGVL